MVTIRQFAQQVGRDHALILRLIKKGIIPQNANGSIPLEAGLNAFWEYDKGEKNKGGRPRKGQEKKKPEPVVRDSVPDLGGDGQRSEAVNVNAAMNKAKLADTTFKARIRELEYKVRNGELLEKTEVIAEAQWMAEQVKAKLLAIPPRVSGMCEGRIAREIEEIITDAINNALKELQKCKYQKAE